MNEPTTPADFDVKEEIDKVASVVSTARRLLADGRMVDLSALEEKVRILCDAIRSTPPKNRDYVRETMVTIIENLDILAKDLTEQFGAIANGSDGPAPSLAAAAYRKPSDET